MRTARVILRDGGRPEVLGQKATRRLRHGPSFTGAWPSVLCFQFCFDGRWGWGLGGVVDVDVSARQAPISFYTKRMTSIKSSLHVRRNRRARSAPVFTAAATAGSSSSAAAASVDRSAARRTEARPAVARARRTTTGRTRAQRRRLAWPQWRSRLQADPRVAKSNGGGGSGGRCSCATDVSFTSVYVNQGKVASAAASKAAGSRS